MSAHPFALIPITCKCVSQEVDTTNTDFDMKDEKGRAVGFQARIWKRTYTEDSNGDFHHAPGDFWIGVTFATRNGVIYGPQNSLPETSSLREMKALAQNRMSAAKARYAKKYT